MNKNARRRPHRARRCRARRTRPSAFFLCGNTRKKEVFCMQKFVQPFFARMRASAREVRRISSMTAAAMLAALAVVLDRFTWQVGPMLEIGVSFLAVGVSGFLYGPWLAGLAGVVIDILGYFLRPNGDFFFGFVLNEFLLGFIYGCWLYRRRVTLARTFGACLTAVLVLNLCLTPLWLHIMYGNAFVLSAGRLLKNIVKLPVDTGLLYALLRLAETRLVPQLRRR